MAEYQSSHTGKNIDYAINKVLYDQLLIWNDETEAPDPPEGLPSSMPKAVYDPQNKSTDIFKYIDDLVGNVESTLAQI